MANVTTAGVAPRGGNQIRFASGLNVLLGIWLIIAPFIFAATPAAFWNSLLVGIFVLILASTRMSRPAADTRALSWTNAVVGIWLIIAPFVLDYVALADFWNSIACGALLLILASWSASLPRTRTVTTTTTTTHTPGATMANDRPGENPPPRGRI
jgi:hypothetical protein